MQKIVKDNDLYALLRSKSISDIQLITLAMVEYDSQHSVSSEVTAEIERRKLCHVLKKTIDPRFKG